MELIFVFSFINVANGSYIKFRFIKIFGSKNKILILPRKEIKLKIKKTVSN